MAIYSLGKFIDLSHGNVPSRPFESMPTPTQEIVQENLAALLAGNDYTDPEGSKTFGAALSEAGFNGVRIEHQDKKFDIAQIRACANRITGMFVGFGTEIEANPEIIANPDVKPVMLVHGWHVNAGNNESAARIFDVVTAQEDLFTTESDRFSDEALSAMLGAVSVYNERMQDGLL